MRAITLRLRTTVRPMPSRTLSASFSRVSMTCSSFDSSSGSSTESKRCWWPRSRIRLRIRSSMVTPADATRLGMHVTMP